MKKCKFLILTLLLFVCSFSKAQKIKVDFIIKNDSLPKKEKKDFIYLDEKTDVSTSKYIGRIKATSKMNEISLFITLIADKAKKRGVNSFKFVSFNNENGIIELILDTYVIDSNIRSLNETLLPKNEIYFFGKDNFEKSTVEEYKLNNEIKNLNSLHFSVFEFNKEVKIEKGKAFGASLKLQPKNDNECIFVNFSGFGASPDYMPNGGIGISFSGGSIIRMEKDTGLLMTNIFTKQE